MVVRNAGAAAPFARDASSVICTGGPWALQMYCGSPAPLSFLPSSEKEFIAHMGSYS